MFELATDYKIDTEHTKIIRTHYRLFLENMDVESSGLIIELFAMKVIDQRDMEELKSIASSISKIERLLSMLSRTSSHQWEQFLMALDKSGQSHVADTIRGKSTGDLTGFPYLSIFVIKLHGTIE